MVHDLQQFLQDAKGSRQADLAHLAAHPGSLRVDLLSADGLARRLVPRVQAKRSGTADNENYTFSFYPV